MGVILGLVLTIHVIASTGFRPIYWTSGALLQAFYIAGLALVIFLAALALGFIIAVSWISERLFKSYTTGFYWGFVVVLIIELILIILKKPEHFLSFI